MWGGQRFRSRAVHAVHGPRNSLLLLLLLVAALACAETQVRLSKILFAKSTNVFFYNLVQVPCHDFSFLSILSILMSSRIQHRRMSLIQCLALQYGRTGTACNKWLQSRSCPRFRTSFFQTSFQMQFKSGAAHVQGDRESSA